MHRFSLKFFLSQGLIFFCIIYHFNLFGQEKVNYFPVQFDQFNNSYSLINPAYMPGKGKFGLELGNRSIGNNFGEVNMTFASVFLKLNQNEKAGQNKHFLGFNFYNDQSGPHFNRSRFYLLYGVQVPLNESLKISGGLGGGGLNYSVQVNSPLVENTSVIVGDVKGGVWLSGEKFYLGYSVNQALNNTFKPYDQKFELTRYYNFSGGITFDLTDNFQLTPSSNFQISSGRKSIFQGNVLGSLKEKILLGLTYHHKVSYTPMVGIQNVKILSGNIEAMISYQVPIKQYRFSGRRVYELTVGYYLQRE